MEFVHTSPTNLEFESILDHRIVTRSILTLNISSAEAVPRLSIRPRLPSRSSIVGRRATAATRRFDVSQGSPCQSEEGPLTLL